MWYFLKKTLFTPLLILKYKTILDQRPGHTVYSSPRSGQVYHQFTDIHTCPLTAKSVEVPGRAALTHRLSEFFFEKLGWAGIPTPFIKKCNMREFLMYEAVLMPFQVRIHTRAGPSLTKKSDLQDLSIFDPVLIEYVPSNPGFYLNEDMILALGWVDDDEWSEMREMAIRACHVIQGICAVYGLIVVYVQLSLGRVGEDYGVIAGPFSPETLCLYDKRQEKYWGGIEMASDHDPKTHYHHMAYQLGLRGIDSPYSSGNNGLTSGRKPSGEGYSCSFSAAAAKSKDQGE